MFRQYRFQKFFPQIRCVSSCGRGLLSPATTGGEPFAGNTSSADRTCLGSDKPEVNVEEVFDQMVDNMGRPRNPPKPSKLLLPSYQPASHPVILGASCSEPTQCSDQGFVTSQLKNAAEQNGFYSPLWVSEAAASHYELQLKGPQGGTALRTPFCGQRFIPLSSLKDGSLIDFIGDVQMRGRERTRDVLPKRDWGVLRVTGTAPRLFASVARPLHLESTLKSQSEAFRSAVSSQRDSQQFLTSASRKWSNRTWISLNDAIFCFVVQHQQSQGRRALSFGEVMDPAVFMRRHVSASGRKASFRLRSHIGVYYNSEQFTDNQMLINMTKTIIMDNLRSVAAQGGSHSGASAGIIPRVEGRIIDINVDVTVQRLLSEQKSIPPEVVSLELPDNNPTLQSIGEDSNASECTDSNTKVSGTNNQKELSELLMRDIAVLSLEARESRRRYEEQAASTQSSPQAPPQSLDFGHRPVEVDRAPKVADSYSSASNSVINSSSSLIISRQRFDEGLEKPFDEDSAEVLDLESCRELTADNAQDAEDAFSRRTNDPLWLVDPLPLSSAEQQDLGFNVACEARLDATQPQQDVATNAPPRVHEVCEASQIDLASTRELTGDDDPEFMIRDNRHTTDTTISPPMPPLMCPKTDVTPREAFKMATRERAKEKPREKGKKHVEPRNPLKEIGAPIQQRSRKRAQQ